MADVDILDVAFFIYLGVELARWIYKGMKRRHRIQTGRLFVGRTAEGGKVELFVNDRDFVQNWVNEHGYLTEAEWRQQHG